MIPSNFCARGIFEFSPSQSPTMEEDFMEICGDDSKFGGKSISSPIKSIEVSCYIKCDILLIFA